VNRVVSELAEETGASFALVEAIIASAPFRYKTYEIPKRSGDGTRTIAQPSREVKRLQRVALERFLSELPVHPAAHAYQRRLSILTNAAAHRDSRFMLKLDLKGFFPSLVPRDLRKHIAKYLPGRFEREEVSSLLHLFFWRPKGPDRRVRLSIGAPSSPFISNTLLFDIDVELSKYAGDIGATYTRYADDMTFSTNAPHALDATKTVVERVLERRNYPRLQLNPDKVVFASKRGTRRVTGLTISNSGEVSLGRDRKRLIRSMYHRYRSGELDALQVAQLQGWLAFARGIEPEFVVRLEQS
jgi:RNA-directed DNA polymerase